MGSILTADDLTQWVSAPTDKIEQAIDDVEARALGRYAPCLVNTTDLDLRDRAKAILRVVVVRYIEAGAGVIESRTSGPFSVKYRAMQSAFTASDLAELAALCGANAGPSGPRGSFPAAGAYDQLFARPRRLP